MAGAQSTAVSSEKTGTGKGRRQRRIATRQAEILRAAEMVFSERGYERATTREIANAADVSEGTLYNYYGSKSEILQAVAQNFAGEIVAEIESTSADDLQGMMSQLLAARLQSGRERRLLMLFLYEARLNRDVHRGFIQQALQQIIGAIELRVQSLIASGQMRPVEASLAARAMSATIMGFAALYEMGQYGEEGSDFSPKAWGDELTDLFLHGLQAVDGRAMEDSR